MCNNSRRKKAASAGTARDREDDISSREVALVTACQRQSKVWPQPVRDSRQQGLATACQRQQTARSGHSLSETADSKVWPQPVRDRARSGHSLSETHDTSRSVTQRYYTCCGISGHTETLHYTCCGISGHTETPHYTCCGISGHTETRHSVPPTLRSVVGCEKTRTS